MRFRHYTLFVLKLYEFYCDVFFGLKFWRILEFVIRWLGRAIGRLLTRGFEFKGARQRRARERERESPPRARRRNHGGGFSTNFAVYCSTKSVHVSNNRGLNLTLEVYRRPSLDGGERNATFGPNDVRPEVWIALNVPWSVSSNDHVNHRVCYSILCVRLECQSSSLA